jgi:hypothetical protein
LHVKSLIINITPVPLIAATRKLQIILRLSCHTYLRGLQNNKQRGHRSSIQWAGSLESSHRGSGRGHGDGFHRLPMQRAQGHLGGHVLRVFLSEPAVLHGTWAWTSATRSDLRHRIRYQHFRTVIRHKTRTPGCLKNCTVRRRSAEDALRHFTTIQRLDGRANPETGRRVGMSVKSLRT